MSNKTVAIIGAGPVGLAAAAHVMERGMTPIVLEAGPQAGHSVRQWQHVQLFSPWEYNVDKAAARLLAPTGWNSPDPAVYPTGAELLERYIEPLATKTALRDVIRTNSRVTAVGRAGFDKAKTKGREAAPFEIRYQNGKGPETLHADAVIDASGTWARRIRLAPAGCRRSASGRPASGSPTACRTCSVGTAPRYAGKTVAVLGAGHSAIGTLTDLTTLAQQAPGTRPIWLLAGQSGESLRRRSQRQTCRPRRTRRPFRFARRVRPGPGRGRIPGRRDLAKPTAGSGSQPSSGCCGRSVVVDELIVATGFRPDLSFLSEIRLRLDPAIEAPVALAPLIDPNEHSCGTVRPHGARELAQDDPGFYLAGIKSYGRAPTFLMITGYEQVRSIAADIAGDKEAAARVELELPETGVCTRAGVEGGKASGCCGGPAPRRVGLLRRRCDGEGGRQDRLRLFLMDRGRLGVVAALGTAQTLAWGSSYYLPAILADPIARDLGISSNWFFAAFSASLVISGLLGPRVGRQIDRVGGRQVLCASNVLLAAGLALLGASTTVWMMSAAWLLLGIGMGLGLYDAAFGALGRIYGSDARGAITGITLIAGFASTVGWPLSSLGLETIGWRETCYAWAAAHIVIGLPLNLLLPRTERTVNSQGPTVKPHIAIDRTMVLLSFAFAAAWTVTSAMAAHLPRIVEAFGATPAQAVFAGMMIGPAQVAARVMEASLLGRFHPLFSTRLACLTHPIGAASSASLEAEPRRPSHSCTARATAS